MPKSTHRKSEKLQCQQCGKARIMVRFFGIDPNEVDDKGKQLVLPLHLKTFLKLLQSETQYKLPQFYCGVCSVCGSKTYYTGQNKGTALKVVNQ